jgi:hypothetical protein
LQDAAYCFVLYGDYLCGAVAARGFLYRKVSYRIGLADHAMRRATYPRVADRGPVKVQTVRAYFRRADAAPAQVLNEQVGVIRRAFARVVGHDGARAGGQRNERVGVARHVAVRIIALHVRLLAPDVAPEFVAFDPGRAHAHHLAVVQLTAPPADLEGERGDAATVHAGNA